MKKANHSFASILIAGIIFFSSCNSKGDKKADENKMDSAAAKTETTVTNPSGPNSVMIVRHQMADYSKWKPAYDAHDSVRLANGLHSYIIARGLEKDSNTVLVAMRMDDVNKAKALAGDPALKDVMKKAGVVGEPVIDFIEAVMNDTTALQYTTRLMIRAKVKDWDAWKKNFDDHKQARADAGLTDRVVAHTAGDNHNVTLVFAVGDMAKANAFLNSQDLKDRMKESGVEGPPDIFFYTIVHKY